MKNKIFVYLFSIAVVLSNPQPVNAQQQLILVKDGSPRAVILIDKQAAHKNIVTKAAQDLQYHLELISGAKLNILDIAEEASVPAGYTKIYVGASQVAQNQGIDEQALDPEAYTIKTIGNNLFIVGRDTGKDDWALAYDGGSQPGTLFGTSLF